MSSLTIKGLDETVQALRNLGRRELTRIVRKGLRAGARVIREAERSEAPKRTGKLAKSVAVKASRAPKGIIDVSVSPRTSAFPADKYYPAYVIAGHKVGKHGVKVEANDFPGRAFDSTAAAAAQAAIDVISSEIPKAI